VRKGLKPNKLLRKGCSPVKDKVVTDENFIPWVKFPLRKFKNLKRMIGRVKWNKNLCVKIKKFDSPFFFQKYSSKIFAALFEI